jgi:hypothetical protein
MNGEEPGANPPPALFPDRQKTDALYVSYPVTQRNRGAMVKAVF